MVKMISMNSRSISIANNIEATSREYKRLSRKSPKLRSCKLAKLYPEEKEDCMIGQSTTLNWQAMRHGDCSTFSKPTLSSMNMVCQFWPNSNFNRNGLFTHLAKELFPWTIDWAHTDNLSLKTTVSVSSFCMSTETLPTTRKTFLTKIMIISSISDQKWDKSREWSQPNSGKANNSLNSGSTEPHTLNTSNSADGWPKQSKSAKLNKVMIQLLIKSSARLSATIRKQIWSNFNLTLPTLCT